MVGFSKILKEKMLGPLDEITEGTVAVEIYWGGCMGDEEDYIAKMRIDQLQGAAFSGAGVFMCCPALSVLALPFLFNDFDEVDYIKAKMRPKICKLLEKSGYKMLGMAHVDFDQIYSTKYEMRTLEDFEKSKILTWYGPMEHEVLTALGASPIPVNVPEVITSMRSGVCNAAISPAFWWVGAQLYTFTKYFNPLPVRYSPGMGVVTLKAWDRLSKKARANYKKALPRIIELENYGCKFIRDLNVQCLESFRKYGLKEVKMTPEEIDIFREKTKPVWDKLTGKVFPKEILDEILVHLKKFRARKTNKV